MRDLWVRAVEFLDRVLREGGCVAVHCAQGAPRPIVRTVLSFVLQLCRGLSMPGMSGTSRLENP